MKLALAMIVKDEVSALTDILTLYRSYFDEVQIAITHPSKQKELEDVCREFKCESHYFEWVNDFSKARNFIASKVKSDYYFRLDCDDTINHVEKIRGEAQVAYDEKLNVVYALYNYGRDEWGNVNACHYRETIIRVTDELIWQKTIHENLVCVNPTFHKINLVETFSIEHHKTLEQAKEAQARNFKYLVDEYNRDRDNTDPRTIAYLGRTFFTVGDYDKAIFFLQKHIEKSGWDEDRYMSWCMLSDLFRMRSDHKKAISCAFEALEEREDYPDAYLRLHDIYFEMEKWEKAIHWGELGISKKQPRSFMLFDPSSYTWRPGLSLAYSYFQLGYFEKAKKMFDWSKKFVSNMDWVEKNEKVFTDAYEHKQFVDKFIWLGAFLRDKEPARVKDLLNIIPSELQENELLIKFRHLHTPPKKWGEKSIVIYCGEAWEEWTDSSVITGIGGSEEAVIYLSRELVKLGYEVTVFNNSGDYEGIYHGVQYINFYKFNPKDEFNIIISWRRNILQYGIKGRKRIVWLHDVIPQIWMRTQTELSSFDKIIVLSNFHRSLLPKEIPDDKIYVSSNGINLPDFTSNGVVRNPHRLIYTSSYDRGLEHLLSIWKDVRKEIPDAELHCYYGWNTYDSMYKRGIVDGKFKEFMLPLMMQEGVFEHGRVGHKELIKEFQKSSVWAYPTHFPEIHCISALKAQACGAIPVVTDYAALKETVKLGFRIDGKAGDPGVNEKYRDVLVEVLKDEKKQVEYRELLAKHVPSFGWDKIASSWSEEIFK